MGILKHLLFWPVTGPLFLTEFALGKVDGVVREQLTDESAVKADLLELQLRLELGEIDDEEFVRQEALLMQRLREVREWRERFGMGVAGGLVRVAGSEDVEVESPAEAPPPTADPGSASIEINLDWD
ncbi:MAG TPA: gas vesicle protein GvpG [Longimicrobiales bacterium]